MNDKITVLCVEADKPAQPFITLEQWQKLKDFVKSKAIMSGYATEIFYFMENIEKEIGR